MTNLETFNSQLDALRTTAGQLAVEITSLQDKADQLPSVQADLEKTKARVAALESRIYDLVSNLPGRYAVKPGDTLWSLSQANKVTVAQLKSWNGLTSNTIEVAQVLWVVDPKTPVPQPKSTVFSFDISNLGNDAKLNEAQKINSHKQLYGVDNVQNIRVFFNAVSSVNWNNERLAALTNKDSCLISFKSWDRVAFRKLLASTPEKFRQRPGQVQWAYWHEFEGDWKSASNKTQFLNNFLTAYKEMAEELDASQWDTQSSDDVVKIFLWYSQMIDGATKGQWQQFIGGQQFGKIGMDCYNYAGWLSKGRYATPEELLGVLIQMGKETGLPICVPEWGGELAAGDTGAGLAKAIAAQGEYMKANNVLFANWWCAQGSKDPQGNVREHHLDNVPAALAEMKKLIAG